MIASSPDQTPQYDLFIVYAPADSEWVEGYLMPTLAEADVRTASEWRMHQ